MVSSTTAPNRLVLYYERQAFLLELLSVVNGKGLTTTSTRNCCLKPNVD
jgi:hypothetical protein